MALVVVRGDVVAKPAVQARLVSSTIIQVLITQDSAPITIANALPRLETIAVRATRIPETLIAEWPRIARPAVALIRLRAKAVLQVAALPALGLVAIVALPARQTLLLTIGQAPIVSKNVVSFPAKLGTLVAVVVERAVDPVQRKGMKWRFHARFRSTDRSIEMQFTCRESVIYGL